MEPTMGRIVYYTPGDPNDTTAPEAPAIVTRVKDGLCDLTVFPPDAAPYYVTGIGPSQSGSSEPGQWCWPPAAPTGSAPEGSGTTDPTPPAAGDGSSTGDSSGEGSTGGEAPAEGEGGASAGGEQGGGEAPTTSAASEKPLYTVGGDVVPDGFTTSGLETPEGVWLWHYAGDTAGQPHTFDVSADDAIVLYAEADDNSQPVQPATPVENA